MSSQSDKNIKKIELVPADVEAARQVMAWRNDPQTLNNSIHSAPKVWPEFNNEFMKEYFIDSELPCLFILCNGLREAFVRFRRLSKLIEGHPACDISVIVAPEKRGKGLLNKQVMERCLHIPHSAGIELVVADIKPDNTRSISLFERSGFVYFSEIDLLVSNENRAISLRRFIRDVSQLEKDIELCELLSSSKR